MEPIPRRARAYLAQSSPPRIASVLLILLLGSLPLLPQDPSTSKWAAIFANHYALHADIVYGHANNIPLKLDVWEQQTNTQAAPTVVYIHGGGWVFGDKAGASTLLMPYFERGFNAVNVEYRMADESLAPAAVEDGRCALRWVFRNAAKYHIDTNRLVLTGHSAGGHLALITSLLTEEAGFDNNCPADASVGDTPLKVAAIVNWYGITDVVDLLAGPNRKTYAVAWLGSQPNREELARRVSPLTYVRHGLPPVVTVHGDQDPTVPYSHATRLHEALAKASVPNQLVTIKGGLHGSFNDSETEDAYDRIWKFLGANVAGLLK